MTINIYSTNRSPLTFDRENNQFREALGSGVISGFQFYQGSPGSFKVSFKGGSLSLNGSIIKDDQITSDFFDFTSLSGTDAHVLIYCKYNPGTDTTVEYKYTSGTHATPAVIDPSDVAYSLALCEVYIYSGSLSIADCIIANRPIIYNQDDLAKYIGLKKFVLFENISCTELGGIYTVKFKAGHVAYISPFKDISTSPVGVPLGELSLYTDTASSGDYDWEITFSNTLPNFIVLFVRGDHNAWDGQSSAKVFIAGVDDVGSIGTPSEIESLLGYATTSPSTDVYPDRANFSDITILGVVDQRNQTFFVANGLNMPVGEAFIGGLISNQIVTISSTAYGSGETATNNDIDIDNVIYNIETLRTATLDSAYDGFEFGSTDGSGRVISADTGSVEIRNTDLTEGTALTSDKWLASLRIHMDYSDTGNAPNEERGVDIVKVTAPDQSKAVSFRRPIQIVATDITGISASLAYVGSQVQIAITGVTVASLLASATDGNDIPNQDIADSYYVTFDSAVTGGSGTANADRQYYKLKINVGSNYFYLESTNGITDLQSESPAHFPTMPTTETVTVWREVSFGPTTVIENLEVDKVISGRNGANVHISSASITGFSNSQDLIEGTAYENVGALNAPSLPMFEPLDDSDSSLAVGFGIYRSRNLVSCGRYVYKLNPFIGVSAQNIIVKIFNASDMSLYGTVTSTYAAKVSGSASICGDGRSLLIAYIRDSDSQAVVEGFDLENLLVQDVENVTDIESSTTIIRDIFMANGLVVVAGYGGVAGFYFFENDITNYLGSNLSFGGFDMDDSIGIDGYGSKMVIAGNGGGGVPKIAVMNTSGGLDRFVSIFDIVTSITANSIYNIACNDEYMAIIIENDADFYPYLAVCPLGARTGITDISSVIITNKSTSSQAKPIVRMNEKHIFVSWYDSDIGALSNNVNIYDMQGNLLHLYENVFPSSSGNYIRGMDIDPYRIYLVDGNDVTINTKSIGRFPSWAKHERPNNTTLYGKKSYYRWRIRPFSGGF